MLTPQFILPLARELVIDLFAGGGGASTGIEAAIGRHVDIAVNHDREAVALHQANHPQTKHYVEDVFAVDPLEVTEGQPVGLLWASPDCFPSGTLVLTREGYTPIEEIQVGDEVLTHRARWRKVTETSSTRRPLIRVKGHGHPGIAVSPEHPFLARLRKDVWRVAPRGYQRTLEPQEWMPASALDKGWYWATLTDYPAANVPPIMGRGMEISEKMLWLAGRYLGDGWTRLTDTRAEVVITCGKHEVERLRDLLSQWPREGARAGFNELAWHERATETAYQFTATHRGLVEWLRANFGHRAESKCVPAWALGTSVEYRRALLTGYLSADGWDNETFAECRTVSKALAFGIKALLNSLGKTVIVHKLTNTTVIDGRTINAREIYMLRWRAQVNEQHAQTFREDGMEWCPIREQEDLGTDAEVFNIGVDEDESYLVEGIVVHNCKHFSKAKGGKPVSKKIRALADVIADWAEAVRPRVICMENVEEFVTWGELDDDGYPIESEKGKLFDAWRGRFTACGYVSDFRVLHACDYGTPTIRKRLFGVFRCDGLPITWPEQTHGKGRKPFRTAAQCIDWHLPCPSIFLTKEEGSAIGVKRPLADATMRRIAKGVQRYVIDNPKPFIVNTRNGERNGQEPRTRSVDEPYWTVTGQGSQGAVVAPHIAPLTHHGERRGHAMDEPIPTVTGAHRGELALVTPFLTEHANASNQRNMPADDPLRTQVAQVKGGHFALVSAFLAQHNNHRGTVPSDGRPVDAPASTITAKGCQQTLVAASMVKLRGTSTASPADDPLHTISAGGFHHAEVRAFLCKYYGNEKDGVPLDEPMHTVPTKDRFGLVTVKGEPYEIVDIGMRMLTPRELYRAQGFKDAYVIDWGTDPFTGERVKLTKTAQVRMCGNSVCPPVAAALVKANYRERVEARELEAA